MTTHLVYRDSDEAARHLLPQLLDHQRAELALLEATRAVAADQIGRIVGGLAALVVAVSSFVAPVIVGALVDANEVLAVTPLILLIIPVAGWLGRVVGRVKGRRLVEHQMSEWLTPSADARADVERFEVRGPRALLHEVIARRRVAALALPMSAAALAGPLLLHAFVSLPVLLLDGDLSSFAMWMMISVPIVGLAHLTLIALVWRHARRLTDRIEGAHDWFKAVGLVTAASCVPGALLLLVPPLISFVTGMLVIPAIFHWGRVMRDREAMVLSASIPAAPLPIPAAR